MAEFAADEMRVIVREETADMRADIGGLKSDVGVLKSDVGGLKSDVGSLKSEVRDLAVKFEHFDAKMDVIAELVTTTVQTRREVSDLGPRVEALESLAEVQKRVIKDHSRALQQLRGSASS